MAPPPKQHRRQDLRASVDGQRHPGAGPQVLAGRAANGRYAANAVPSVPGGRDLLLCAPCAGLAEPGIMGVPTGSGGRPAVDAQAGVSWGDPA